MNLAASSVSSNQRVKTYLTRLLGFHLAIGVSVNVRLWVLVDEFSTAVLTSIFLFCLCNEQDGPFGSPISQILRYTPKVPGEWFSMTASVGTLVPKVSICP